MNAEDQLPGSLSFTVVMPVYNAREYLELTIPPLLSALRQVDGELVVMDNGSTDGSLEWLEAHAAQAQVHPAPHLSLGALRNAGARRGNGDVLSFIDADCVVPPNYFLRLQEVFEESGAEAVGNDYALPSEPGWIESDWHNLNLRMIGHQGRPLTWVPAGNFACLREPFERIGGFNESLVTGEDTELCLRLRQAGGTLWGSSRIQAVHLGNPKTLMGFFRKQKWHALGMFGTARKQWFDRPTLLTIAHAFATVAGLVILAMEGGWLGVMLFVGLTLLSPALAVSFRALQSNRPRSIWRALLLFHLYLDARAAAMISILVDRGGRTESR